MRLSKKTVIFIVLSVFFVATDRFLKALCIKGYFDQPVPLIDNIFTLNYVKNYYIAFSLPFSGPILASLIGIIIIVLIIYWLKLLIAYSKLKIQNYQLFPLTILIIGAFLNFIDRIKYGFVIDYFNLKFFTIFNLADCLICFGVILLLYFSFKKKKSAAS